MSANKKLADEWFERAKSDLSYAKAGQKETSEHHITCFLCQQAVEKCLKGMIVLSGEAPRKIHNLGPLLQRVVAVFPAFAKIQKEARKLAKFYISARYPDDIITTFTKADAEGALKTAEEILQLCYQTFANL